MLRVHPLLFPEDADIPRWASPNTSLQERNLEYLPADINGLYLHLSGRAKVRQSLDSPWNQIYCLVHNGKAITTAAIKLVLLRTKHNETRDALVTRITKIVFTALINLHLYFCEWQVFIPHMEGTLGEAVFQYLLTILWKDIQSVNFQIKIEHYIEK